MVLELSVAGITVSNPVCVEVFLKDANDGCYGNPLHAGYLEEEYSAAQVSQFVNYESLAGSPHPGPLPEGEGEKT